MDRNGHEEERDHQFEMHDDDSDDYDVQSDEFSPDESRPASDEQEEVRQAVKQISANCDKI